jgi:hypothetical protein
MKKTILLLAIIFGFLQISCDNFQNQNSSNDGNSLLNSQDKFVGKWIQSQNDRDYYKDKIHLDIRKEDKLYIIDFYMINNRGEKDDDSYILTGKLNKSSIEITTVPIGYPTMGNIDLSEQTNKLYFGGSEYTKE